MKFQFVTFGQKKQISLNFGNNLYNLFINQNKYWEKRKLINNFVIFCIKICSILNNF